MHHWPHPFSRAGLLAALALLLAVGLSPCSITGSGAATAGELELRVVDADTKRPIAVRMHLKNSRGKVVRSKGAPFWKDHFAIDGKIILKLSSGRYTFEMERGPEYKTAAGYFSMERNSTDNKLVEMQRFVDMKKEGWWSGDLHVHRPLKDIELLMRADDLHVAPVITWWNNRNLWQDKKAPDDLLVNFDGNRFYHRMAGEDEREGGALLYFNLTEPLPLQGAAREYPSPVKFLEMARDRAVSPGAKLHIDIEKPFWWDMPVWAATGKIDSIGLCNNHLWRTGGLMNEAWGKPRDQALYPNPEGNGRWSQDIYYHLLNCGLRIPPSAGSASGVLNNPLGYNRVYVHCGEQLDHAAWWEGLRQGRVVVTNGPLLRPRVNGELPGHVFEAAEGEQVTLKIALKLSIREKVEYLEIIKDGRVAHEVRLAEWAKAGGKLPPLVFDKSGWMLVRAVTTNQETFRVGMTGPYYVEIGGQPRISKRSAQFFVDWVYERARRIKLDDETERREVLAPHRQARDFWQAKLERANVE